MILELNATEIIACAVDKHVRSNKKNNSMAIRISHIQSVARKMEVEIPTLLTKCDMVAIEDCQCVFKKNMKIKSSSLHINKVREITSTMLRYLPQNEIYVKVLEKV